MPSTKLISPGVTLVLAGLLLAACTPAVAPQPTPAPAKPAAASAPAPTAAPAAKPAATAAPAARPAATAAPAAKPTAQPEAKPAASPAAKPAARQFDERAVADFYRGKTIRIIVGFAPGGGYDIWARFINRYLGKYVPGNPSVIVENKPGAGSMLAANLVYNTEPKDGTAIATFNSQMVLQQALGQPGMEFDARTFNWLGSTSVGQNACMIRKDTGITDIKQVIGPNGREVAMGGEAPGSGISDTPAVMNAALGTRFRIIYGYEGAAKVQLAVESREVDGFCLTWDSVPATLKQWFEPEPMVTIPIIMGSSVPNHPYLKNAVAAEAIAPSDQARKLLQVVQGPRAMTQPYAVAPGVPSDRVAALRTAFDSTLADPAFVAEVRKQGFDLTPKTGEAVGQLVKDLLSIDPQMVETVKKALQPRT